MEFSKSSLLPSIIQAALTSLTLELESPLTAVLHFLRDLLGYAVGHVPSAMKSDVLPEMQTVLREIISASGSPLCSLIMSGMIFTFPRDCVTDGAGALMTLIEMDPRASVAWVGISLSMLPQENLSQEERARFMNQVQMYFYYPILSLTSSAADSRDYRRIQRQIQDFVAIYRRRVVSPRNKSRR